MHGSVVRTSYLHLAFKDIVVNSFNSHYFVLEILYTVCCSSHYHAHEVSMNTLTLFELVKSSDMYDHSFLNLYSIPHCHSCFVPLKCYLIEKL